MTKFATTVTPDPCPAAQPRGSVWENRVTHVRVEVVGYCAITSQSRVQRTGDPDWWPTGGPHFMNPAEFAGFKRVRV